MVRRNDAILRDVRFGEGYGVNSTVAKMRGQRGFRRIREESGEVGDMGG